MARTKTKKRFDFSDCKVLNDDRALFKERYKNDSAAVADMALKHLEAEYPTLEDRTWHYKDMTRSIEDFRASGNTILDKSWVARNVVNLAFKSDPANAKEVTDSFLAWYDATPDAQEVYKYIAAMTNWWWHHEHGNRVNVIEATALGYTQRPPTIDVFNRLVNSWEGQKYRELNREEEFQEGDLVVLRTPFIGNYRYDPHYNNKEYTSESPRYATVVQANEGKIAGHRRGKGSRAITVIWFGKDGVPTTIGEKFIKHESRKGRIKKESSNE